MSDNTQPKEKSYILVQFEAVGSAIFMIKFENVTPEQAVLAASILELQAKNEYIAKENTIRERQAQQQLSIPKQGIIVAK